MNFGRQPQKVTVTLAGDPEDVGYWRGQLARLAEFKGDTVAKITNDSFVIFPRAVND